MFASFALSLDDAYDLSGPGLSLSMRLKRTEENQLQLELESSAALTSCECRINEPEMRRLTHSMLPKTLKTNPASTISSQVANSAYLSPKPLQLYVSKPSADSESPEKAFVSPSTIVPQSSCEPELSSVSKLAAVSSTNELSKCFQSVGNSRMPLPDVPVPQKQRPSPSSSSSQSSGSSDNESSSSSSSGVRSRSRSASLPLTGRQITTQSEQNRPSTKQEDSGSDTSDSEDSDNNNTSSAVSALLQRAAIPHSGSKKLDVKQGIDLKKQREKLHQASALPLEALMSPDFMNAAVSMAKQKT